LRRYPYAYCSLKAQRKKDDDGGYYPPNVYARHIVGSLAQLSSVLPIFAVNIGAQELPNFG